MRSGPKHKLCRRLGSCIWGNPKCPSAKRPFSAGQHGSAKSGPGAGGGKGGGGKSGGGGKGKGGGRNKLSGYGQLLMEKQKLRVHYGLSEHQLRFYYENANKGTGQTGDKLLRNLELRLATVVFRSGIAPSISAARQAVLHRHIQINGKVVNRSSYRCTPGEVLSVNGQKSPAIFAIAQKTDVVPPPYLEVDKENVKVTIGREPVLEEIPVNVKIVSVVEFYAR